MGFALFASASMAMAARDALQVSMKQYIFITIFILIIIKSIPFNCTIFLIRMHYGIAWKNSSLLSLSPSFLLE